MMITASHNPKQYNGLKFCLVGRAARRGGERPPRGPRADGARTCRRPASRGVGRAPRSAPGLRRARAHVPGRLAHAAAHRGDRHRERDGRPRRPGGPRAAAVRAASPLPGARRHVPEPPRGPDRPREPARPEGRGPAARGGHRARVRRRRRPRVPDRRARPGRERFDRDGARRQGDARARAGREHHLQRHLLVDRAGGHPRERRRAGSDPRRSLVHQAGHGGDGRDLRGRALRALLLPGELPRGLRSDRRGGRAGAALARRTFRSPSCSRRSAGTRRRARSTPR